jgi:hypothetical protein
MPKSQDLCPLAMPRVKINMRNFKQITAASHIDMMPWRSLNRLTAFSIPRTGKLSTLGCWPYAGRHIDGLDTIGFHLRLDFVVEEKEKPCIWNTAF